MWKGFLAKSWHITSRGMFAGSCIGVICLVLVLEFLRRVGREYDAFIVRRARLRSRFLSGQRQGALSESSSSNSNSNSTSALHHQHQSQDDNNKTSTTTPTPVPVPVPTAAPVTVAGAGNIRPTLIEQLIRAILHMLQFAVAYFIMLLAMYFNGYIIICIFIGAFLGAFIFSWEPLGLAQNEYVSFFRPAYWHIDNF